MRDMQVASMIGSTPQDSIRLVLTNLSRRLRARKIVNQLLELGYNVERLEEDIIEGDGNIELFQKSLLLKSAKANTRVFLSDESDVVQINTLPLR